METQKQNNEREREKKNQEVFHRENPTFITYKKKIEIIGRKNRMTYSFYLNSFSSKSSAVNEPLFSMVCTILFRVSDDK